jgi:hypothetical protein
LLWFYFRDDLSGEEKTTCLLARGWARWAMAGVADAAGVAGVSMKLEEVAEKHASLEAEIAARKLAQEAKNLSEEQFDEAAEEMDQEFKEYEREEASRRRRVKGKRKSSQELLEDAQAAEVRALRLATAEALVQQRAAFLADVITRAEVVKADCGGREDTHSLLQVARSNTAVAKAMEELAEAKLKVWRNWRRQS